MRIKRHDKQMAQLPKKVEWCKRCVISNQRPRIKFDDEGICAACNNRNSRHGIDWEARHIELMKLLQSHRNSMEVGMLLCRAVVAKTPAMLLIN